MAALFPFNALSSELHDPSLEPLDVLLPDWLPPSIALPEDPDDAFLKALAVALDASPTGQAAPRRVAQTKEHAIEAESRKNEPSATTSEDGLWRAAGRTSSSKPSLLMWDEGDQVRQPPALLSHHPRLFYAALRRVLPTPDVSPLSQRYMSKELRTVVQGFSGSIWLWNDKTEAFETARTVPKDIMIEGFTSSASSSLIIRFRTIGTLLRRLETIPDVLRSSSDPWCHAFSHALQLILSHVRKSLEEPPPSAEDCLISLHLAYQDQETLLRSLSALVSRGPDNSPPYRPLPASLLSAIHSMLSKCISNSDPHTVQCALSFLLQAACVPSFRALEDALGLGRTPLPTALQDAPYEEDEDEEWIPELEALRPLLPDDVALTLQRGRRSLSLLRKACPAHPLCSRQDDGAAENGAGRWIWTDSEVVATQIEAEQHADTLRASIKSWRLGRHSSPAPLASDVIKSSEHPGPVQGTYALELTLPDLAPLEDFAAPNEFTDFLKSHPAPLMPSLAPSLSLLVRAVLSKLISRSKVLGQALLDVLISQKESEGGADLLSHLSVLKSFHMLSLPPFTDLLATALFVHPSPEIAHGPGTRARTRARLGLASAPGEGDEFAAVGLGVGLTQRGRWPPGGAELSWVLRRVLMDALVKDMQGRAGEIESPKAWQEAEWRVGFAIRHLDEGDDAWLDPLAVEALDFLDLQYKPPESLTVLLDEDALQKYRRLFTFLLRLLRVDIVVRTLYHPSHHLDLFPLSVTHTLLLRRLCFEVHAFVSSLVTYVYDSAIRGSWDPFMSRLTHLRDASAVGSGLPIEVAVQDVFALSVYHHSVLDSILEGCLLRSGQVKAATPLKSCMAQVLLLGQLVLDRRRGTVGEEDGVEKLRSLADGFGKSIRNLVEALKQYEGRGSVRQAGLASDSPANRRTSRTNIADLLLRLNFHGWY